MSIFQRNPLNPLLSPNPENHWESYASFNGSVLKEKDIFHIFYRAMSQETTYLNKKLRISTIGHATSTDGITFGERTQFITPENDWELYGCEDPRVTSIDGQYYIFYTALSNFPPNHQSIKVAVAISKDLKTISEKHLVTPFNAKAMVLFPEKINNLYTVLLTANTDMPPSKIGIAQFTKIETLWDQEFWNTWYENIDDYIVPIQRVSTDQVEIGSTPVKTDKGWILLHSYIKNYFSSKKSFRVEAVLLKIDEPKQIIGRIEDPCLTPETKYELEGQISDVVFPEGAVIEKKDLRLYYGAADSTCCLATVQLADFMRRFEINTPTPVKCTRFLHNPLLQPIKEHDWENKAVFNPAAVDLEGKTYLVYRTLSAKDISYLGCAISHDGVYIDERLSEPIYSPRTTDEIAVDKNKGYGCEDPRITLIHDTLYMCYTAYDGVLPRLAITSISKKDFLLRSWDKWAAPKIISPPGVADKDGCLFPEKIKGKYAFFHRIEPNIVIDFVDDLEFIKKPFLSSTKTILPRSKTWDDIKIGINAPPLKTKAGWIVFYHGISQIDHHYRLGAMLLDLADITNVIGRTEYPILEPVTYYEKEGIVNNVVFPCGYSIKNDTIFLYYGGADKIVAGAHIALSLLIQYLERSKEKRYLSFV